MSRRYGRSQRRRARERIAEQDRALANYREAQDLDRTLLMHQRERIDCLEAVVLMVRQEIPHFVGVEPESITACGAIGAEVEARGGFRLLIQQPTPSFPLNGDVSVMDSADLFVEMDCLLACAQLELARQEVHVFVQLGPRRVAYAVSEPAVATLRPENLRRILQPQVAGAITQAIVQQIEQERARRRRE